MKTLNFLTSTNLIKFLTLVLVFVFTSCEKKEEVQWPNNPYDYIGQEHNELMTNFKTQHGEEFDQIESPLEAEVFIIDRVFENPGQGMMALRNAKEILNISPETPLSEYNFMNSSTLCDVLDLPSEISQIICPTVEKLLAVNGNSAEGNKEIHKLIRDAEIQLFEKHQFDDGNDFQKAMTFLAVLGASSDLNEDIPASGKPKWWQVVLADAVGAGIGVAAGGVGTAPLATAFSAAVLKI